MANTERQIPFSEFYSLLQARAGISEPKPLIAPWDAIFSRYLAEELEKVVVEADLMGLIVPDLTVLPSGRARTNQSKGNVLANALADALRSENSPISVQTLRKGRGYPDQILSVAADNWSCCLEVKATSGWDDGDSNRRVLTCSHERLAGAIARRELPNPPNHLLATILYDDAVAQILALRLDFLEPSSLVNVRLEASTSHALLKGGAHHSVLVGTPD